MVGRFLIQSFLLAEDYIVRQILRSPGFHRGVRRIHDRVQDYKHGRNPHEPLREGEATRDPNKGTNTFLSHFIEEIQNSIRGTSSNSSAPRSRNQPPKK